MIADPLTLLLLTVFGGWVALDGTSVGQFMLSRPVVAASLAGWIVGAPVQGASLGLVLEALHLMVLPVGAARHPEAGPAAVASAGAYAAAGPGAAALLTAVIFALLWERIGGASVQQLRKLNMALATPPAQDALSPRLLERRHLAAILLDFLRGSVLVGCGVLILSFLLTAVTPMWGLGEELPRLLLIGALAASLGACSRLFQERRASQLLLAGAACGLLVLFFR